MLNEDEEDVSHSVWINVDFVLLWLYFLLFFLYLYSDDVEIVSFAACMSLHEPSLVWQVWKGGEFLLHWSKLRVYFRGLSCTRISLCLHRGRGIWVLNDGNKWLSSDNDEARQWSYFIFSNLLKCWTFLSSKHFEQLRTDHYIKQDCSSVLYWNVYQTEMYNCINIPLRTNYI